MTRVDFYSGPWDGEEREWDGPLQPEVLVPRFGPEEAYASRPGRKLRYAQYQRIGYDYVYRGDVLK